MSETPPPRTVRVGSGDPPFSADAVGGFEPLSKSTTFTHTSSSLSGGIRALSPPAASDKSRSKWKSRFTTTKKEVRDHADASSLSSATLESQKLEEIDLKSLSRRGKHSGGGKFAQHIKVSLSQRLDVLTVLVAVLDPDLGCQYLSSYDEGCHLNR